MYQTHAEMMNSYGGTMMIGMGLFWLLIVIALALSIAALIKYLRAPGPR